MKGAPSAGSCCAPEPRWALTIGRSAGRVSDAEFVAKLGTVIEECDESAFWLELLADAAVYPAAMLRSELIEANELLRIFVASRETVRRRIRSSKSPITNRQSQIG